MFWNGTVNLANSDRDLLAASCLSPRSALQVGSNNLCIGTWVRLRHRPSAGKHLCTSLYIVTWHPLIFMYIYIYVFVAEGRKQRRPFWSRCRVVIWGLNFMLFLLSFSFTPSAPPRQNLQ